MSATADLALDAIVQNHLGSTFPAAQIEISFRGECVLARAYGYLDPETTTHATDLRTRFDLASVTKLFTVTCFMSLVEAGCVALDQPVYEILSEFSGARLIAPYPDPLNTGKFISVSSQSNTFADASSVTFRHLLAHNSGLPAWLPLWKAKSHDKMLEEVLLSDFAYPIGTRTIYSDIGLILLGLAIERLTNESLAVGIQARVARPLGLDSLDYGPLIDANVAPTEFSTTLNKRLRGQVHDENAYGLGGVAGHAGLFATSNDTTMLGAMYLRGGLPLLKSETVAEMKRLQAQDGDTRRGLGFALWSPDTEASGNPFSRSAFGHTGFTGTSMWVDPDRELVVSILTNRVYYGRNGAKEMSRFRVECHRAIVDAVDHQAHD
ncbi:MAG TPA: serine hydrolase [Anaerolineae bacterium]